MKASGWLDVITKAIASEDTQVDNILFFCFCCPKSAGLVNKKWTKAKFIFMMCEN